MAKQTRAELDALISKAGLGARSAKKLHKANETDEPTTEKAAKPRGHGAAAPATVDLGDF